MMWQLSLRKRISQHTNRHVNYTVLSGSRITSYFLSSLPFTPFTPRSALQHFVRRLSLSLFADNFQESITRAISRANHLTCGSKVENGPILIYRSISDINITIKYSDIYKIIHRSREQIIAHINVHIITKSYFSKIK